MVGPCGWERLRACAAPTAWRTVRCPQYSDGPAAIGPASALSHNGASAGHRLFAPTQPCPLSHPAPARPHTRVLCLTMNPSVDLATETPRVLPTHKLRCSDAVHDAGGGGINVARVIMRLGGHCESVCPAGGPSGHWLEVRMAQDGLHNTTIPIAEETRVSFCVHEARDRRRVPVRDARAAAGGGRMAGLPGPSGDTCPCSPTTWWPAAACRPACPAISTRGWPGCAGSVAPSW